MYKKPDISFKLFGEAYEACQRRLETAGGFERIYKYNNLQQFGWVRQAVRVGGSVGRVVVPGGFGTGWLISDDLILTNNHVIDALDVGMWIEFNYETDWQGNPSQPDRYQLVELLKTNESLDYTILRVAGRPGDKYGFINVFDAKAPAMASSASRYPVIIQHPQGGFKHVALTDNLLTAVGDSYCWYTTDTEPGSSGSPVFDQLWRPIALHHAGVPHTMPDGTITILNEGVILERIIEHAADVLGARTEHVKAVVLDLLKSGQFTQQPTVEWYVDNPRLQGAIKLDARGNQEWAPLIAAAAGVAAGVAAAHLGHQTSKKEVVRVSFPETSISLEVPASKSQGEFFLAVYDFLHPKNSDAIAQMLKKEGAQELVGLAGAFLAGVAAGAAAYQSGK